MTTGLKIVMFLLKFFFNLFIESQWNYGAGHVEGRRRQIHGLYSLVVGKRTNNVHYAMELTMPSGGQICTTTWQVKMWSIQIIASAHGRQKYNIPEIDL